LITSKPKLVVLYIKSLIVITHHILLTLSSVMIAVVVGRNQPLKPEKPRWSSDELMTEEQLCSQRDQFWDTAPAFEGHKEIWDALKAAAYALESGDQLLAQAIVDGANIMLPTGM